MDPTTARWRFQTIDDAYGTRVSLMHKDQPMHRETPISAIIGTDWDAGRIASTLIALEEMYAAQPEPTPPSEEA